MNTDTELEILPPNSLEAITRGEIDMQIATAHRYPRSIAQFLKGAMEMVTLDEETAASCLYSRPVGNGKFAEGMSVRMAEIVTANFGNIRIGSMIISQTERQVVCRGFAHDLEKNVAVTSETVEATIKTPVNGKPGEPYDERMRAVIAKAALAKARRDATFQVVPRALCKPLETAARRVAIGDASTIAKRRTAVLTWIGKLGIDVARVWKALGIAGEAELGIDELTTLVGIKTAIKDGEVSVDEAFPSGEGTKPGRVAEPPKRNAPPEDRIPMGENPGLATEEETKAFHERIVAEQAIADKKAKAKGALKATPLQGIQNLCRASSVKEGALLEYLKGQGACDGDAVTLENVAVTALERVIADWPAILPNLQEQPDHGDPAPEPQEDAIEPNAKSILGACIRFDLDQKQVVQWAKGKKWCDAKAKFVSDLNPSAMENIAANIETSKDEISTL